MTVTATYLDDLGRVRIAFDNAPPTADYAIVERSRDRVRWETIRGGNRVAVSGGSGWADDYEYSPSTVNHYRVRYVDSAPVTLVDIAEPVHADNADVTPDLPAGVLDLDLLTLVVTVDGSGTPVTPDGWDLAIDYHPIRVYQRLYDSAVSAPTVTLTGGVSGDVVTAVVMAHRNATPGYVGLNGSVNSAPAMVIAIPTFNAASVEGETILVMWRSTTATGFTVPPGLVGAGTFGTSLGTEQATMLARIPGGSGVSGFLAQDVPVSGGTAGVSRALVWEMGQAEYLATESTSITPTHNGFWLKNLRRPNLNRKVTVTDFSSITRPGRSGVFEVIGRTLPVAVTELQGSRRMTVEVMTRTLEDAQELDHVLASGEVLLMQGDGPSCPIPTMYVVVGDIEQSRRSARAERRFFSLPVTEVARPDLSLFVGTVSWLDVTNEFASWADVLAAEPSWDDVLSIVAGSDVIVE